MTTHRIMLTADAVGGVWRQCVELAAGLTARGARVLVVAMGPRPNGEQRAEIAALSGCKLAVTDLPLDWTAENRETLRDASIRLAVLAAAWRADSVQLHAPALVGTIGWPAPVVTMAHSCVGTWWRAVRGGDLPPDLAWRAEMTRLGLLNADVVTAPSKSFADELISFHRLKRPVHVIANGAQPIGMPRTPKPHALTAGRLWDEGKNIATLDEAAALCGVPIRAAGSVHGPNGASIAARHLRLLGNLGPAALAREYAHAAVFVSVARYEPFGLAVLEAAQAGCALLLADIPTFRELWSGAALFVDPSDVAGIAGLLRDMIADPASCERRGTLARRRGLCFTADAMAKATWAVHRELVTAPVMAAE